MAYVECDKCKKVIHIRPLNVTEFNKRFIEGKDPVYCMKCFKDDNKQEEI